MNRLTRYLVRQFAFDAVALLLIISTLLWLTQCLRIFDVVAVRGQNVLTLMGQAFLSLPTFVIAFLYVVMGIGLARALRSLQANNELGVIHSSRLVPSLMRGAGIYSLLGALFVLFVSHFVEPNANRSLSDWSAQIAADLVGRTLTPHRFTQIVPGVVVLIGGRAGNGEITEFFADDRRDPGVRRTYVAESATIAQDETGNVLQLRNGALQYSSKGQQFSEVRFGRYDIAIERLSAPLNSNVDLSETDSWSIVQTALNSGVLSEAASRKLIERTGEGLRVFGICLIVFGLAGMPSGRRRAPRLPLELVVLILAFVERGFSTYVPIGGWLQPLGGTIAMIAIGLGIVAYRFRPRAVGPAKAQPA